MYKSLLISFVLLVLVIFAFPFFYIDSSQVASAQDQQVVYDLPYPGILPDNPLYFLKATRDKMQEMLTRDNLQKAQLYLLLSDKRLNMAQSLFKKGRRQLAITTMSKGEKYALKIPNILTMSKKQGVKSSDEFINKVKLSNDKHKETIEGIMKDSSQEELQEIEIVLHNNEQTGKEIQGL